MFDIGQDRKMGIGVKVEDADPLEILGDTSTREKFRLVYPESLQVRKNCSESNAPRLRRAINKRYWS